MKYSSLLILKVIMLIQNSMRQVARALVRNSEGKYLIVMHPKSENWTIPGGHIDEGETIQKAVKRELKEEFNIKIKLLGERDDFGIEHIKEVALPVANYKIYYDSKKFGKVKKQEYIFHAEVANLESMKVCKKEIKDHKWVTPEELYEIENIFPQIPLLLKKITS